MRKLSAFVLLFSFTAQAGLPPTTMKNQNDTNPTTTFNWQMPANQSARISSTTALIDQSGGLLKNGNCEDITAGTGWTSVNGGTITTSSSVFLDGKKSCTQTPSAASGIMAYQTVTPPSGFTTGNFEVGMWVQANTAGLQVCAVTGTTSLNGCLTVTPDGAWHQYIIPLAYPGSGNIGIAINATASYSTQFYWDKAYTILGTTQFGSVSQAQVLGTTSITGCAGAWTNTVSSYTSFTAQTGCTYTNSGGASAPSTIIPGIKFASIPAGDLLIVADGYFDNGTAAKNSFYRMSDGTNISPETDATQNSTGAVITSTMTFRFSYTSPQSNVTLQLQNQTDSGGTSYIYATSGITLNFKVYYFPSQAQAVQSAGASTQIWSGYHDNTCSWARTNTAFGDPTADTTCNLVQRQNQNFGTVTTYGGANTLPGIVLTPASTGLYWVCSAAKVSATSLGAVLDMRLYDNNNAVEIASAQEADFLSTGDQQFLPICGVFQGVANVTQTISLQTKSTAGSFTIGAASSSTSSVDWTVYKVSQSLPMPLIANSVVTGNSGVEVLNRATIAETTACTVNGACTINRQSGSWLTGVTRTGTGGYTASIASGVYSAPPTCTVSAFGQAIINNAASTSTSVAFATLTTTGSYTDDQNIQLICQGPK